MWTKKNNKGAKITKKGSLLKGTVSTDMEEILEIEDSTGDPDIAILLEEISYHLTATQQEIINMVVKDPSMVKPSGKLNIKRIAETLHLTWFETDKQIRSLSIILDNEL